MFCLLVKIYAIETLISEKKKFPGSINDGCICLSRDFQFWFVIGLKVSTVMPFFILELQKKVFTKFVYDLWVISSKKRSTCNAINSSMGKFILIYH